MDNNIFYSYPGKVLSREDKDFIITIWPDVPFYLGLPCEYAEFMKKITVEQFKRSDISDYLSDVKYRVIFDYLTQHKIISASPQDFLSSSSDRVRQLYYVSLQVTEKCNLRCKHCYASAGEANYANELTLDQWKSTISGIAEFADVEKCIPIITGGEPLLRRDILDIIDFAMAKLNNVVVVTNSLLLTDELIAELASRENLMIQVSLDGARRETHEYIRGKGTYDRAIRNIEKLVQNQINVGLSPICTETFFEEIDEYFQLAKKLGVKTVQLQPVQYIGRALTDQKIKRVNGDKLIRKITEYYFSETYHDIIQYGLESKSVIHMRNLNKLISCGTGHGTMYICANGDVYSCPNMMNKNYVIGNVTTDNLCNLYYNSPVYRELRALNVNQHFGDECANCEVKHFCGGGCRGVCLANRGTLYGRAIECESLRAYFTEILWTVCERKEFYRAEAIQWLSEKTLNSLRSDSYATR